MKDQKRKTTEVCATCGCEIKKGDANFTAPNGKKICFGCAKAISFLFSKACDTIEKVDLDNVTVKIELKEKEETTVPKRRKVRDILKDNGTVTYDMILKELDDYVRGHEDEKKTLTEIVCYHLDKQQGHKIDTNKLFYDVWKDKDAFPGRKEMRFAICMLLRGADA